MRWMVRLLVPVILASGLWSCRGRTPELPRLTQQDVVLAFGDSLTYGTGAAENESYPAVLGQLIGRKVVRSGVPGEVTAQGLARLPVVLAQYRPRLLLLCLGGNDMLRKQDDARIIDNLRAMVREAKESGVAVVLIGVPRPALLFASAPAFYADIAAEFDLPYQKDVLAEVLRSAELKSDPIHPNAKGYRKIAEALAQLLRRAGAVE